MAWKGMQCCNRLLPGLSRVRVRSVHLALLQGLLRTGACSSAGVLSSGMLGRCKQHDIFTSKSPVLPCSDTQVGAQVHVSSSCFKSLVQLRFCALYCQSRTLGVGAQVPRLLRDVARVLRLMGMAPERRAHTADGLFIVDIALQGAPRMRHAARWTAHGMHSDRPAYTLAV